jgi:hypothetical protein
MTISFVSHLEFLCTKHADLRESFNRNAHMNLQNATEKKVMKTRREKIEFIASRNDIEETFAYCENGFRGTTLLDNKKKILLLRVTSQPFSISATMSCMCVIFI